MMRASSQTAGARVARPGLRPLRAALRVTGGVAMVVCWTLVIVLAALTWGPHLTRYKTDIIVGRSMEPTIPLYSVIVVEPVEPMDVRRGDVISYQQPDRQDRKVTHRVHAIEHTPSGEVAFVTKGDANAVRDPYQVIYADGGYRVVGHVPHVGWLLIQTQTRWARVLLVVVPVLFLLVQFLRWVWRDPGEHELATVHALEYDDERFDEGDHDEEWLAA